MTLEKLIENLKLESKIFHVPACSAKLSLLLIENSNKPISVQCLRYIILFFKNFIGSCWCVLLVKLDLLRLHEKNVLNGIKLIKVKCWASYPLGHLRVEYLFLAINWLFLPLWWTRSKTPFYFSCHQYSSTIYYEFSVFVSHARNVTFIINSCFCEQWS